METIFRRNTNLTKEFELINLQLNYLKDQIHAQQNNTEDKNNEHTKNIENVFAQIRVHAGEFKEIRKYMDKKRDEVISV